MKKIDIDTSNLPIAVERSPQKRLFISLPLPREFKELVVAYRQTLRNLPLRMIPFEDLHITLVFLGPTPKEQLPEIKENIQGAMEKFHAARFMLRPLCFEPGPDRAFPNLVWLTLEPSPEITALQDTLREAFEKKENRPFFPHVTIARIRPGSTLWSDKLTPCPVTSTEIFQAKEVDLMESILTQNEARYSLIKRFMR